MADNFDKNLVQASYSKDLIEAKEEWEFFREEKCDERKTCICDHNIKSVQYFLNKINGNIICCGTICCKKFNFDKKTMSNKTLEKIFNLKLPYNKYKQFSNIKKYLDYSKNELESFMITEINNSNFNNLIFLLENIININQNYDLTVFDSYIESIKIKISDLTPFFIEYELRKDLETIFDVMKKYGKLKNRYQIELPNIKVFESIIDKIVDHNISNYSGYTTPPLQEKIDKIIKKIEIFKEQTGKTLLIKDFLINSNNKLKAKIQSIIDYNFQCEKRKYEDRQKREENIRRKYPDKYYF